MYLYVGSGFSSSIFFSVLLQILQGKKLCPTPTHLVVINRGLSYQWPLPPFHPTKLHSHLPPNHSLRPHTCTLPPVTQDLTPDLTPTHHISFPGRQSHAQTFQDNTESTSCNLNSGGECQHGTRTDLKHMEDRQAHAQVTRGVGVRHHLSVPMRGGEDLGEYMFLNSADSSSLSE